MKQITLKGNGIFFNPKPKHDEEERFTPLTPLPNAPLLEGKNKANFTFSKLFGASAMESRLSR